MPPARIPRNHVGIPIGINCVTFGRKLQAQLHITQRSWVDILCWLDPETEKGIRFEALKNNDHRIIARAISVEVFDGKGNFTQHDYIADSLRTSVRLMLPRGRRRARTRLIPIGVPTKENPIRPVSGI